MQSTKVNSRFVNDIIIITRVFCPRAGLLHCKHMNLLCIQVNCACGKYVKKCAGPSLPTLQDPALGVVLRGWEGRAFKYY